MSLQFLIDGKAVISDIQLQILRIRNVNYLNAFFQVCNSLGIAIVIFNEIVAIPKE
jgi:hypothetical protein